MNTVGWLIIIFVVAFFFIFSGALYMNVSDGVWDLSKTGAFGDSFGTLTSLFSGLAFAGLIITILMQKEELRLQREELVLTRAEMARAAEAAKENAASTELNNEMETLRTLAHIFIQFSDRQDVDTELQEKHRIRRDKYVKRLVEFVETKDLERKGLI